MKLLTIIALILVATFVSAHKSSHKAKRFTHKTHASPFKVVNKQTAWASAGKGSIYYLDRQNVDCPNGSAMSWFHYERKPSDTGMIRYNYNCVESKAINTSKASSKSTPYNSVEEKSDGKYAMNYLDRHNVVCPAGTAINKFRQGRSGNKINIKYECVAVETVCCKSFTGAAQSAGNQNTYYLDRQNVGDNSVATNMVMTQYKAFASYSPSKLWYTWTMCQLVDVDARAALKAAQDLHATNQAAVATAQAELKVAQDKLHAAEAELNKSTPLLQSAHDAEGLKAKCG